MAGGQTVATAVLLASALVLDVTKSEVNVNIYSFFFSLLRGLKVKYLISISSAVAIQHTLALCPWQQQET